MKGNRVYVCNGLLKYNDENLGVTESLVRLLLPLICKLPVNRNMKF